MKPAISVENLSKKYTIGERQPYYALRDALAGVGRRLMSKLSNLQSDKLKKNEFWALENINFDINPGEIVGIVGRNGAGKTTLLKIISQITPPSTGIIRLNGRVGSLLEVGTGFHPELTGRENIYLNGAILGMKRWEIKKKFDEIIEFAEIEKFLDTPVKHYSYGMYMRLAFSVAAHLEPEILLIDEVLAVGDYEFQKKCLGKMKNVAGEGRTVLFVSHNLGAISEICQKGLLIDQGKLIKFSGIQNIITQYTQINKQKLNTEAIGGSQKLNCQISHVSTTDSKGNEKNVFDITDQIILNIDYSIKTKISGLQLTATISSRTLDIMHSFDTDQVAGMAQRTPGKYLTRYIIPSMFLKAGTYSIRVTSGTPDKLIQDLKDIISFDVEELSINTQAKGYRRERPGLIISPGTWKTDRLK